MGMGLVCRRLWRRSVSDCVVPVRPLSSMCLTLFPLRPVAGALSLGPLWIERI